MLTFARPRPRFPCVRGAGVGRHPQASTSSAGGSVPRARHEYVDQRTMDWLASWMACWSPLFLLALYLA